MKRIFLVGLTAIILVACQPKDPVVKLDGQIENMNASFALLLSEGIIDTIFVDDEGFFNKSIDLKQPEYVMLRTDRVSSNLFLTPGASLTINLDLAGDTKQPEFIGDNANINEYLIEANNLHNEFSKDFRELYSLDRDEFIEAITSAKEELLNLLESKEFELNEFVEIEKYRIDYLIKGMLYDYPRNHAWVTNRDADTSPENYQFMDEVNFNNPAHLSIPEYRLLLTRHFQRIYMNEVSKEENKTKTDLERNILYLELVDSLISNQIVKDYLKHDRVIQTIQLSSLDAAKAIANYFVENAETERFINNVSATLEKRMLLASGNPAPEFTLTDINGKTHSLSDFRGQLVYLDFWATWCGPCRQQIPYLKKLKEAYEGKPVAFVAISLDDNKDAWEKMVKEKGLGGYQLHADKAWSSDAAQKYQIRGVPTFILIDGEGIIIEYPTSRPSDPKTTLLLDEHLKNL